MLEEKLQLALPTQAELGPPPEFGAKHFGRTGIGPFRVKWFFVRTAARARSDPARDAGRLAMARSFHVNVRHESSLD